MTIKTQMTIKKVIRAFATKILSCT